ncbi:MAG TPA: hypothetical protein VND20_04045 [Candidatus Binataceae bacterium]|nr:hypothetical protein [Candidatus Binataceae bacterium]
MKRGILAGLVIALITASPAFAAHHRTGSGGMAQWGSDSQEGDDGSFSPATLTGTYIFEANGFMNDGAQGSAAVLGTLTFDGVGVVSGNLTITAGDTGQWSCADTFTAGSYTLPTPVSGPGLGTLVIPAVTGSINFNLIVPSPDGSSAHVIDSVNGPPSAILCTGVPALTSLVLTGHLSRVSGGGGGGD